MINAVKKTKFGEEEAQNLIEILLNKTSGGSVHDTSAEWVESGPKNDVGSLKKELAVKEAELQEEAQRVRSVTERMTVLRQELNAAKSQQVRKK